MAEESDIPASQREKTSIEVELEQWTDFTPVSRDIELDILDYWKGQSSKLPLLARLAKNVLGVQVSSAPSERLFSEAGLVVSAKRQIMATSQCERLVFIHENHDQLAPYIKRWKTDIKEFADTRGNASDQEDEVEEPQPGTSAAALRQAPSFRRDEEEDVDDPEPVVHTTPPGSPDPRSDDFFDEGPFPPAPETDDDDVQEVEDEEEPKEN